MAMISQKDQLALHEFSMRLRESVAAKYAEKDQISEPIKDAVREQYQVEQDAKHEPEIQPPAPTQERDKQDPEPEV